MRHTDRRWSLALLIVFACPLAFGYSGAWAGEWENFDEPDFIAKLDSAQTVPLEPNDATGKATFWLNEDGTRLRYRIKLRGVDLDGWVTKDAPGDDVTKIHLHNAPPGVAGPHVLNILKAPSEDDRDLVIIPFKGVVGGIWDDRDENLDIPAPSLKLTDVLPELCAGNVYVNVHTVDHLPGAVRGQVLPVSDACDDDLRD